MSYVIEQKIKGRVYLYEVESYWDSEKKQARQRRKYLGKKDDNGQIVTPRKLPVVSSASEYGNLYLLNEIADQIGLSDSIFASFSKEDSESILSLAYFQVTEGKPMYLYETWHENRQHLAQLTSQEISKFLGRLGGNHGCNLFFQHWAAKQQPLTGAWLDITSLSSYSQQNSWVEWGYNRDGENLPQINLGVLLGNTNKLPFFYQLYPGSIADVSTLHNIALRSQDMGFNIETWVMDRGFYSASNLEHLEQNGYQFITAMPGTLKAAQALFTSSTASLRSPVSGFCLGKEVLFSHDTKCKIGKLNLRACVILSEKRRAQEIEAFVRRLETIEQTISNINFENEEDASEWLNLQWKGCSKFFSTTFKNNKLILKRKRNAISFRMNRMGKTILITNRHDLSPKQILDQYRSKDRVEKVYDSLKNSLREERLRVHSADAMHGKMFVTFIALIIQTELTNRLYKSELSKTYTIPEILMETRKIRMFSRSNGQPTFLSEISKKQRNIFTKLNINIQLS